VQVAGKHLFAAHVAPGGHGQVAPPLVPRQQTPLVQSLLPIQPRPSAHTSQAEPPQSTSVSKPFTTWSLQLAATHLFNGRLHDAEVGQGQSVVPLAPRQQIPLLQSAGTPHPMPAPQSKATPPDIPVCWNAAGSAGVVPIVMTTFPPEPRLSLFNTTCVGLVLLTVAVTASASPTPLIAAAILPAIVFASGDPLVRMSVWPAAGVDPLLNSKMTAAWPPSERVNVIPFVNGGAPTAVMLPLAAAAVWTTAHVALQVPQPLALPSSQLSAPLVRPSPQIAVHTDGFDVVQENGSSTVHDESQPSPAAVFRSSQTSGTCRLT
jgi:hypothetical protein